MDRRYHILLVSGITQEVQENVPVYFFKELHHIENLCTLNQLEEKSQVLYVIKSVYRTLNFPQKRGKEFEFPVS